MLKMSAEYWRPGILDDNLHSIAFALIFFIVPSSSIWAVSVYIGVLVYVPEVIIKTRDFPESVKGYARKCERSEAKLLQTRGDTQAWLRFALVALWTIRASRTVSEFTL